MLEPGTSIQWRERHQAPLPAHQGSERRRGISHETTVCTHVQQQMGRVMQWLRLRVWVGALWGIGRTHAVNRAVQRMQGAIRGKWAQMQAGQLAKAVCDMQRQAQEMRQQLCEGGIKLVVLQQRMANGTVGAI